MLEPCVLKHDLIRETADEAGHPHRVVREVLDAAASVARAAIARGESVMLMGLGKLHAVQRGEKRGRNLRTGEVVLVPPRKAVLLQPSESLVDAANHKR